MKLTSCGSNSVVECLPSKQGVAGSNPVSRSNFFPLQRQRFLAPNRLS